MVVAIIGASNNSSKFGNIAVRSFASNGHTVFPVNPHCAELGLSIEGLKSYRNVLIFSFFLNIILNPILITGKILSFQIISPLGIEGIAYATIISQFMGIFYLFIKLTKTQIYKHVKFTIIPNFIIIKTVYIDVRSV